MKLGRANANHGQQEIQPDLVKEGGCLLFRDENAKAKLMEWGYPRLGGERYAFDEHLKGWEQFDTAQDAPYYGIWTSVDRMATVSFCEGDVTLVVAPDLEAFRTEVRALWDWNRARRPEDDLHTQMDSPRLQEACLVGHPAFDSLVADYRLRQDLSARYVELHRQAYEKLADPSLPAGRVKVLEGEHHRFFIRGRAGDFHDLCACRNEGFEPMKLNWPDYDLPAAMGGTVEKMAFRIGLLEELLRSGE